MFNVRSRLRYLSGTKGGEEKGHQTEMKRERKTEGMTGTQLLKEETRWRANTKTAVLEEEAETGDERQTEKAEMSDERVETADVASGGKEDAKGVAKKPEMSDEEREKELFYAEMEKARRKMEKRGLDFIHLVDDYPIAEKQWNARKHSVYRYIFSKILPMAKEKETESLELREELMKAIFFKAKMYVSTPLSNLHTFFHRHSASLIQWGELTSNFSVFLSSCYCVFIANFIPVDSSLTSHEPWMKKAIHTCESTVAPPKNLSNQNLRRSLRSTHSIIFCFPPALTCEITCDSLPNTLPAPFLQLDRKKTTHRKHRNQASLVYGAYA